VYTIAFNTKNTIAFQVIHTITTYVTTSLNSFFQKRLVQTANKYMKRCSASLAIKEMQIKTTLRFHLIPVRMAITKNTTNASENAIKHKPLYTVGGNED
jgi:hypothetical protein